MLQKVRSVITILPHSQMHFDHVILPLSSIPHLHPQQFPFSSPFYFPLASAQEKKHMLPALGGCFLSICTEVPTHIFFKKSSFHHFQPLLQFRPPLFLRGLGQLVYIHFMREIRTMPTLQWRPRNGRFLLIYTLRLPL